ncbi:MAG: hypothetical protein COB33_014600 [Thiotrichaceae bacterium]|nr:hypothetical protein [Thiotrichaceae bacterium]PCI13091.1 MAG: hypothetical protein COB71_06990 [Thiotrichales bacterium]
MDKLKKYSPNLTEENIARIRELFPNCITETEVKASSTSDDFSENTEEFMKRSNQKDEEGNRLIANTEANGRFHLDWLTMIYPRLELARAISEVGVGMNYSIRNGIKARDPSSPCEQFSYSSLLK